MDTTATRQEIILHGQPQAPLAAEYCVRTLGELNYSLNAALAERLLADDRRTLVVLKRASNDFRSACATGVDEDYNGIVRALVRFR